MGSGNHSVRTPVHVCLGTTCGLGFYTFSRHDSLERGVNGLKTPQIKHSQQLKD